MINAMHRNEVRQKIIKSLENIIQNGRWEGSLFLKNILKRLQKYRESIEIQEELETSEAISETSTIPEQKEGYERIYIELYQAACENLSNWAKTIKDLSRHYVSRPIYKNEQDVQELIRSKRSRTDAYVTVWVKKKDIVILPPQLRTKDRLGHELIKVKENSIELENIIEFVHDKISYLYSDGQLIVKEVK